MYFCRVNILIHSKASAYRFRHYSNPLKRSAMTNRNKLTDDQLVKEFVSGDNEAFDVLLHRYQDRLYSYILFTAKNNDVADDIFQETFVRVVMQLRQGRYTTDGKFYSWLTRIAHNLLVDQFRNEKNENYIYDEEAESAWNTQASLASSIRENEMNNEEVMADVRHLMEKLPEAQREILRMRFYQDLTFKEIAAATGMSINTALARARYGIMNMRKMAKKYDISLQLA